MMQFITYFCILIFISSFCNAIRNHEYEFGLEDKELLEYNSAEEVGQDLEHFKTAGTKLRDSLMDEKGKFSPIFKAMISATYKNPARFQQQHYSGHTPFLFRKNPYIKTHNLDASFKNKRYMGVEVTDFVQGKNGNGEDDLGEGGQDSGDEGGRHRKVRLLGSG